MSHLAVTRGGYFLQRRLTCRFPDDVVSRLQNTTSAGTVRMPYCETAWVDLNTISRAVFTRDNTASAGLQVIVHHARSVAEYQCWVSPSIRFSPSSGMENDKYRAPCRGFRPAKPAVYEPAHPGNGYPNAEGVFQHLFLRPGQLMVRFSQLSA